MKGLDGVPEMWRMKPWPTSSKIKTSKNRNLMLGLIQRFPRIQILIKDMWEKELIKIKIKMKKEQMAQTTRVRNFIIGTRKRGLNHNNKAEIG